MNTEALACAIVGHLVGDYLLQNDWMALNKKRPGGGLHCLVHVWIWTLCVCAFAGWWSWGAFMVLFGTHFVQDRTQVIGFWMTRVNRQPQFAQPPMAPWSLIVVDNVWHIVAIWVVWRFIV